MSAVRGETEMLLYFADALRDALGLERLYTGRDPIDDPHRFTVEQRERARFDLGSWSLPEARDEERTMIGRADLRAGARRGSRWAWGGRRGDGS